PHQESKELRFPTAVLLDLCRVALDDAAGGVADDLGIADLRKPLALDDRVRFVSADRHLIENTLRRLASDRAAVDETNQPSEDRRSDLRLADVRLLLVDNAQQFVANPIRRRARIAAGLSDRLEILSQLPRRHQRLGVNRAQREFALVALRA